MLASKGTHGVVAEVKLDGFAEELVGHQRILASRGSDSSKL